MATMAMPICGILLLFLCLCGTIQTAQKTHSYMPAKLQFFSTQAKMLMPYLVKYQAEKPVAVFMAEDLANILNTLIAKFIEEEEVYWQ